MNLKEQNQKLTEQILNQAQKIVSQQTRLDELWEMIENPNKNYD